MTKIKSLLLLLFLAAPLHAYQGGSLKNHAHTSGAGDGGALTVGTTLLGSSPLSAPLKYRRPNLIWLSSWTVTIESSTVADAAADVSVLFPDNTLLTMNATNYTTADVRTTMSLSGTASAGVQVGTATINTWYAGYAAKLTNSTTSFVLVLSTITPVQTNLAALNSILASNGWVYLGMIRHGDNNGFSNNIVRFRQNGHFTVFTSSGNASAGSVPRGIGLASATGAATLTYTFSAGVGASSIPSHLTLALYQIHSSASGADIYIQDAAGIYALIRNVGSATGSYMVINTASEGIKCSNSLGAVANYGVLLSGYWDAVLGVGSNPFL